MRKPHIGYVLKRYPRASETFIAQEILELERQGSRVSVLTLWPNDQPAPHSWLRHIRAKVTHCGGSHLSETWKWMHRRSERRPEAASRVESALRLAFRYPDRRGRHRLCEAVAVARATEQLGLDHLHAHFANEPAFVTLLAHHLVGVPFSFTAHAKDIYLKAPSTELWREQVEEASFAVTVCEANRRHIAAILGEELEHKVLLLHNGVDLEAISPSPQGNRTEPPVLFCAARLIEKKGVDVLLRAADLLRFRGLSFSCEIVGEGPERDGLIALAAELKLEDRVTFRGALPHEELLTRLQRSAVKALPARVARDGDRDALPTVLLEAMAAGLPCVSTPVAGIPEIIDHGKTGLVVRSDSPWALAEALAELLERPEVSQRMGVAGRRRAERLFDRSRNAAQLGWWMERSANGEPVPEKTAGRPSLRLVEGR